MSSNVKAIVIKCSKMQFEQKRIFSFLRIKARLASASSIALAVEDAGTYKFFLLRDMFYYRNIPNGGLTDKPFTIQWNETPEELTFSQMPGSIRNEVTEYLNSDHGLNTGYGFASLDSAFNVQLPYCQRFFTNPDATPSRSIPKRIPERNPFLRNATVGEIVREMNRRGYSVECELLQEKPES